jgi:hypothetical protein
VVEGTTGGIVDHLKLVGAFELEGDPDGGYAIVEPSAEAAPASWTGQGYPFYSGRGVYRTKVEAPAWGDGGRVLLDVPMVDDVLEVEVNGRAAGVRLWHPYVVELTDLLRPGENDVALRVANTVANLLNGVDRPSGMAGAPRLVWASGGAPARVDAGSEPAVG